MTTTILPNFERTSSNRRIVKGAQTFNECKPEDQQYIVHIFNAKRGLGEFANPHDLAKCIEETALLYKAQLCAFEDVLRKKGYEVVSQAPHDYHGNIALITINGTLALLGKLPQEISQNNAKNNVKILNRKIL